MLLDWIEDPALSGSVVKIYNNKTFICAFYNRVEESPFDFGRYLKKLILMKWGTPYCCEDFAADIIFEINANNGEYTAFEAVEDLAGEYEFEVTLMGNNLYMAIKHNLNLLYFGRAENMPEEV